MPGEGTGVRAPGNLRDAPLIERDEELALLGALVDSTAAGRGGLAVVEGEPGIGKTRLLRETVDRAQAARVHVLSARGSELEEDFPFGVARQLLEPILRGADAERAARLLGASTELASAVALGTPAPRPDLLPTDTPFAVLQGLYWLLVGLAEEQPVLLFVDDLQWADDASQRFLAFVAGRLAGLPVGIVTTVRTGGGLPAPPLLELTRLPQAVTVRPTRLTLSGLSRLVAWHLGAPGEDRFVEACAEATGGVPFYARELLRDLSGERVEPTGANAPRIAQVRPESVVRSVLARVARVSPSAVATARGLAVLGDGAREEHVAALAGVGPDAARDALADLERAGIVAGSGGFAHPIMATSVYHDIPAADRADLHRRAARFLLDSGEPPDRVALQLLRAAPAGHAGTVEVLRVAARHALERGAALEAVTLLRRALAEPPEREQRAELLFDLGASEVQVGLPEAIGHLQEAFDRGRGQSWWGEAALALGRALMVQARFGEAAELVDAASAQLADTAPDLSLRLEVEFFLAGRPTHAWQTRAAERIAALEPRLQNADSAVARLLLGDRAMHAAQVNEPADVVVERARRAWGAGDIVAMEPTGSLHYWPLIHSMICGGDVSLAENALQSLLAESRRQGSGTGFAMARLLRAILGLRRGTLLEAEADVLNGLELVRTHLAVGLPLAVGIAVEALVERGDTDRAEQILSAQDIPPALRGPGFNDYFLCGRGCLHMARHRFAEARADFLAAGESMLAWNTPGPSALAWRSRAALAALAVGDRDEAVRLASEEVELAEAFGAPHTVAVALHAAGLTTGGAKGEELLERAVATLDDTPFELEAARCLTDLGTVLRHRRAVGPARECLRRGFELASRCGAGPIADRARRELVATGARPRRAAITGADSLTATEGRICDLAAVGLSNREIAQELFLVVKTVEFHLTSSYRKLGITSRSELKGILR